MGAPEGDELSLDSEDDPQMTGHDEPDRRARIDRKVRELPTEPGCYLMKDAAGEIFYIGKAANLRARVRSYFTGADTRQFVAWLDDLLYDLEFILVNTEKEALLLERTLVREHQPRFNVLLRDDKNFIHLRLARPDPGAERLRKQYPRLEVVRNPRKDEARYFGPFHSASNLRASLRVVNRHFQLRTCSDSVLENRRRPCLQYQIGRCPAPCVQSVPDYGERADEAALFLGGRGEQLLRRLQERMWEASEQHLFEAAAQLRDQVEAVKTSLGRQVVTEVSQRRHQDVIGVARSGSLLEITRMVVRGGKLVQSESFRFDKQEFPTEELVTSFLSQIYGELVIDELPDQILTGLDLDEEAAALAQVLTERRGKKVEIKRPQRGQLRRLVEIAEKNAEASMAEQLRRTDTREKGLERLQKRLRLSRPPRVMECFDVSLFQGAEAVASQVVFVDGAPDKSRYRRYNIRHSDGNDDFGMMYEALCRRLKRGRDKGELPDLLLVDGGKGQLNIALTACQDLGIEVGPGALHLAAIAKGRTLKEGGKAPRATDEDPGPLEESPALPDAEVQRSSERVFLPNVKDPILLRPHTQERYLVEQIRDEAHRFAITAHRRRRSKRTLRSALDDIPGVGPAKRRALIKHFGGVAAIKEASVEELCAVPGIGRKMALSLLAALNPEGASEAPPTAGDIGDQGANSG